MSFCLSAKKYCAKPFNEISIDLQGEIKICCDQWVKPEMRSFGHLEQSMDWDRRQIFQQSIIDQSYRYCRAELCPFLKEKQRGSFKSVKFELSHRPKVIHFNFDNSCNLQCPSCRTEVVQKPSSTFFPLINQIKSKLSDAEQLMISGRGDPFGSPTYFTFLRELRSSDFPNLKRIHLHTNGLLFTKDNWNKLSNHAQSLIKWVDITIDASCASTYALNRGGDFITLQKNLRFMKSLGLKMTFIMVVQENNYQEMLSFYNWAKKFSPHEVRYMQLENWGSFSDVEYQQRAIFHANHPQFHNYQLLRQKLLKQKFVANLFPCRAKINLGNLPG